MRKIIPSPQTAAQSILDNFLGYQSGGIGKRRVKKEDIVWIMDESGSVSKCQFDYGRDAFIDAIKLCEEEEKVGKSSCRNAGITFDTTAEVDFKFLPPTQAIQKNEVDLLWRWLHKYPSSTSRSKGIIPKTLVKL